jgi:hypothetical protein
MSDRFAAVPPEEIELNRQVAKTPRIEQKVELNSAAAVPQEESNTYHIRDDPSRSGRASIQFLEGLVIPSDLGVLATWRFNSFP